MSLRKTPTVCGARFRHGAAKAADAGHRTWGYVAAAGALLTICLTALIPAACEAAVFTLPHDGTTVVGRARVVTIPAHSQVTLLDIGRHYDVGYQAMVKANPHVDVWLPGAGTHVVVPTQYLLPPKPWKGIVINLPERRLFYFPPHKRGKPAKVYTFPIGIFQRGFPDPLGKTRIIAKFRDPKWVVPKDIRKQAEKAGNPLPKVVKPGPNNPMGELALETGFSEIFIHGTSKPWGVGMRPSHGCFHLYPEDARTAFKRAPVGTQVRVINEPFLVGTGPGKTLYFTAFQPLKAYTHKSTNTIQQAINRITNYIAHHKHQGRVDWTRVKRELKNLTPLPVPVSTGTHPLKARIAHITTTAYKYPPYTNANNATPPPPQHAVTAQKKSKQASAGKQEKQSQWSVQIASFDHKRDAQRLIKRLQTNHTASAFESAVRVDGKTYHRVLAGHLSSKSAAIELAKRLKKAVGHPVQVRQQS